MDGTLVQVFANAMFLGEDVASLATLAFAALNLPTFRING